MILFIVALIGLLVLTFLPSFLEAGAFFVALSRKNSEAAATAEPMEQKDARTTRGIEATVVAMVILRINLVSFLSVWMSRNVDFESSAIGPLAFTFLGATALLGELGGKIVAIRFSERARRAAEPICGFIDRFKIRLFSLG